MKTVLLVSLTLIAQRALGWPGLPPWTGFLLLPMVWIVGPPLERHEHRWIYLAIPLGLAWDLLLEEVVGPGGISWSGAALALSLLAGIIADRTPKAWLALGAAGAAVVLVVRFVAMLPLGVPTDLTLRRLALSVVATGAWCGLVGWLRSLDLRSRWRAFRARKLR